MNTHPLLKNSFTEHQNKQNIVEKVCAWVCLKIGSPVTLAFVIIIQILWIVVGQLTGWDSYPFEFLLTVSNVIQLVLIFILALGQRQTNEYNEIRAKVDHESISKLLYEVEKLTQDK